MPQWLDSLKMSKKKAAANRPIKKKVTSMITEIQTIDAHGFSTSEYRYEPTVSEDDEPIAVPLTCGQCDYYKAGSNLTTGNCTLLGKERRSSSLACPQIFVTCPF